MPLKNEKGIVLVVGALLMVMLIIFAGFAIDLSFMYMTKGQLQNAADASALAGAALLDGSASTSQFSARAEAQKFAAANIAAKEAVQVDQNTSNVPTGDIVVGWWNGTDVIVPPMGKFCNAVKVTCRRTSEQGAGISTLNKQVKTFFSGAFGWKKLSAKAQAVAIMPPMATAPLSVCSNALSLSAPTWLYFKNSDTGGNTAKNVAFTEFGPWSQGQPPQNTNFGPNSLVAQYIQGKQFPPDVCHKGIYTQNSGAEQIITVLQEQFAYENGLTGIHGSALDSITGSWKVIVPVGCIADPTTGNCASDPCDPTISGQGVQNRFTVNTYAMLEIGQITSNPTPAMYIKKIEDVGCSPNPIGMGLKPRLAK